MTDKEFIDMIRRWVNSEEVIEFIGEEK